MSELAGKLEVKGKRIVAIAGPGDRRDEDLKGIARAAAGHFDIYICKADDHRRGRSYDEAPKLMAEALREEGIDEEAILIIPDEADAVDKALAMAANNDLVMIFGDAITRCWKQIITFGGNPVETTKNEKPVHTVVSMLETNDNNSFVLEDGMKIVKDERGVRVVFDSDEGSD